METRSFCKETFIDELHQILNWWSIEAIDEKLGGFIGRIDGLNKKYPGSPKGSVLNTRILWTFSAAANMGFKDHEEICHRAYEYILDHFLDKENGGIYWMLNAQGLPIDTKKQVYAQAFCIYAFTEYNHLTGKVDALDHAMDLFNLIESNARDKEYGGYYEAFTSDWQKMSEVRLSEKEGNDAKTMNTHLHILEAYTNLYRHYPKDKVKNALSDLIDLYCEKFVDSDTGRLKLFYDDEWNENYTHHSPGHEIESCWLLNEASHVLGDPNIQNKTREIAINTAKKVLEMGVDGHGSILNEIHPDGSYNDLRDWWPQAEGVIGFYDAYQNSKDDDFLWASKNCWSFIDQYIKDHNKGEWFWGTKRGGTPLNSENKLGPWKAPYHNARMCIEMIKRLQSYRREEA